MTRAEALQVAKPILFNTEMVRAILDGRKTVTRRIVKPQPNKAAHLWTDNLLPETVEAGTGSVFAFSDGTATTPPYNCGDVLYVRETWRKWVGGYSYKADAPNTCQWKPSIHMPKEAARVFLRVTGVCVEQLQDIISGDYKTPLNINREGLISPCSNCTHHNGECKDFIADNTCRLVDGYILLWNSTVKKADRDKYGWEANPWVWVIEFERLEVETQ